MKNGTEMIDNYNNNYIYKEDDYGKVTLYMKDKVTKSYTTPDYSFFSDKDNEFKILSEKDEEIDIQAIACFAEIRNVSTWCNETLSHNQRNIVSKINEIIKALKQLDKK